MLNKIDLLKGLIKLNKYNYVQFNQSLMVETKYDEWVIKFNNNIIQLKHVNKLSYNKVRTHHHGYYNSCYDVINYLEKHDIIMEKRLSPEPMPKIKKLFNQISKKQISNRKSKIIK